ncbi:MAG TPA: GNAT family N-acetyltransferase [Thermoanaerobaculia bacterium]|nr:GNAT family N-acetyltransferase [Thermoanaerobaculia bacterium]
MHPRFSIRPSRPEDVSEIVRVVNAAFEVERFFVDGERTTVDEVRGMLENGTFFLAEDGGPLAACVYLEIRPGDAYFGMLSVDPTRQGEGLGRLLVEAAEEQARAAGCEEMEIHVVDLRTELPPFYRRLGYVEVGTVPMEPDPKFKQPCQFIVMRKPLV